MAITENDIIMQRVTKNKDENGNTTSTEYEIFYPSTRAENVLCEDGENVEEKISNIDSILTGLESTLAGV